ncbi:response regulator receiver [Thermodesulfatator indicus DSM 15286]|uniref:Response regulator receiver n=1 Tax=Thermodesulfatator indicus (strain DSM 15286 / JCM 11887 / CIR29812) TaxID=667014 RepID=F8AAA9_THEID|nr:response regulator [Thermodesulfatator indicus]AEH44245.1 response regulator receiver [Thermodesulfatator indicus DSM 15286]
MKRKVLLGLAEALALDFEKILAEENLNVIKASDGQELLDLAREEKPDLIILERKLPVLDGLSAVLLLKNDPETQNIPVIVVCECRERQEEEATDAGCDAYLTRPLTNDKIKEILNRFYRES